MMKPEIVPYSHLQMAMDMVRESENLTHKPYHDTKNKLTIGYGRNLEDRGIRQNEAELMLANDVIEALDELGAQFGFFKGQSDVRKAVLVDLYHNMGITRLLGFKKMLSAWQLNDYDQVAKELKNSRYWSQVGDRAKRNYCMILFNRFYTKKEAKEYFDGYEETGESFRR